MFSLSKLLEILSGQTVEEESGVFITKEGEWHPVPDNRMKEYRITFHIVEI